MIPEKVCIHFQKGKFAWLTNKFSTNSDKRALQGIATEMENILSEAKRTINLLPCLIRIATKYTIVQRYLQSFKM